MINNIGSFCSPFSHWSDKAKRWCPACVNLVINQSNINIIYIYMSVYET